MKYIKTFEATEEYKIGDYVQVLSARAKFNGEILEIDKTYDQGWYLIDDIDDTFWIRKREIFRRLTLKEIKKYKLKKGLNKYNI